MKTYTTPGGVIPALANLMASQNHILVAGATGSGKSVLLNTFIHSRLLYLPWDAQLVLIDPKRVELRPFAHTPHCIGYASEPDLIHGLLEGVVGLMESRYTEMAQKGWRKYPGRDTWVIIDEFADLMTTDKKRMKPLICRIAQLGRAANIHLILATQRPTRDIIDGQIKVNMDCRIALRCPTRQDSRNIIERGGAEELPAYGYGYILTPPGDLSRMAIPFTPDAEITARVGYWENQNKDRWGRFPKNDYGI